MNRFARFTPAIAASLAFAATLGLLFSTVGPHVAQARGDVIMAPDGGRLDAVNARGELIGPCPLRHTDVHVDVSGSFARVTLQQRYGNPYTDKIEAVYTFPLSHRGAVDRMTMTIGDRVVVGEVKERQAARATYEAAKSAGHAAALLEQERPNIFTQSVANIEPGVEIVVEISYVELLEARDGLFGFSFPLVVAPRYIPGGDDAGRAIPDGLKQRDGVNLLAPGTLTITANGDTSQIGALTPEVVNSLITDAIPIEAPPAEYWTSHYPTTGQPALWHQFELGYLDGQREAGVLYTDGLGQINGRWFYINTGTATKLAKGTGSSPGSAQIPDAARITPQPVKPTTRAGHDISITVNIDTGGPGITDLKSESHAVQQNWGGMRTDGTPSQVAVSLNDVSAIPNKDFVLHWRQTADTITEQVFTHADARGGFITLILNPPARVENTDAVPRELVFVLDTSGSMQGFPIEKAKDVMNKAIAALRPQDTFNVITFAGDTNILWTDPQPASPDKLAEAQQFVASREGRGGTEMMTAINAALTVKPETLRVPEGAPTPVRIVCFLTDGEVGNDMAIIDAVKKNAATTRVFSFGIGNSVNRYLLDGIAKAGRGAAEYVLLSEGADEKVATFTQRIQSPVLMNVKMEFAGDIQIVDRVPEELPDLYDVSPVIVHARYTKGGKGSVTLRGDAGSGPYEKIIELDLPEAKAEHDVIATLWAREKVEQIMNRDLAAAQNGTFPVELKKQIIDLGERFQIMSQFTSFVAVENLRVTVGGQPRLVPVPIELPEGQSWEGTMGEAVNKWADEIVPADFVLGARLNVNGVPQLGDIPAIGSLFGETQQAVADKLKQTTGEINLDNVSFEQAVNRLRDQSGVNIAVNWSALETAAIEKDKQVSLHVKAGTVTLETALKLLTEEVGGGEVEMGSKVGDGVVQISTKEDLAKRTTVEVYNVEDLIHRFSDFQTDPKSSTPTDNDSSGSGLFVYHLKHKTAYDIGFTIEDMLKKSDGSGPRFDEGPDEKTLIAKNVPPEKRDVVRRLVEMFDVPSTASDNDGLLGTDTKDIPPEVLARVAREIAEQSKSDATRADEATIAAAGKEIIAREQERVPAPAAGSDGISDEARQAIPKKLAASPIDVKSASSDKLVVVATESDLRKVKDVIDQLDAATAGNGSHTNREGNEALYFEGKQVATASPAESTRVSGVRQLGKESALGFDRRPKFRGGWTSAPTATPGPQTPGQPPAPEALGRGYQPKTYGMIGGLAAASEQPSVVENRFGVAGEAPTDSVTQLRAGVRYTTAVGLPGGSQVGTTFGEMATSSIAGVEWRIAGRQTMPTATPGLNPQTSMGQNAWSRGRNHEYVEHAEPTTSPAESVGAVSAGVPVTQTGAFTRSNEIRSTIGLLEEPRSATPTLGDFPGLGDAFKKMPANARRSNTQTQTYALQYADPSAVASAIRNSFLKDQETVATAAPIDNESGKSKSTRILLEGMTPAKAAELIRAQQRRPPTTTPSSQGSNLTSAQKSQSDLIAIDEAIVGVATLALAGRLPAAARIADELVKYSPDHTVIRAMHDVLNCYVITNESCIRRLCELAAPSARRLTASAERARLMARRLDERLLRLALADKQPVAPSEATAGIDLTDAGVLVTVLVDAFGDGTVAALTKAGLKIESTSKPTRVVIGRVAIKHLGDVATCKHIRRVEAIKPR